MDLENQYYNSKALKEDDPKAALSSFQKVGTALSNPPWQNQYTHFLTLHHCYCYCFRCWSLKGRRESGVLKHLNKWLKSTLSWYVMSNKCPFFLSCTTGPVRFHPSNFLSVFFFPIQTNFPEMMNRYKQLLTYIRSAVTRNYSEKSINSILDYISTSKQVCIRNFVECLNSISRKNKQYDLFYRWTCSRSSTKLL